LLHQQKSRFSFKTMMLQAGILSMSQMVTGTASVSHRHRQPRFVETLEAMSSCSREVTALVIMLMDLARLHTMPSGSTVSPLAILVFLLPGTAVAGAIGTS
ncbi:hypothetical protein FBU30_010682, partial [Linnemannia zychae]